MNNYQEFKNQFEVHLESYRKCTAKVEDLLAFSQEYIESMEFLRADLSTITIKQLKAIYTPWGNDTKKHVVSSVLSHLTGLAFFWTPGMLTWVYGGGSQESQFLAKAKTVTQEQLDKVMKEDKEKRDADIKQFIQAITDPQDISEFEIFVSRMGFGKLSDEQLERYDALLAFRDEEIKLRDFRWKTETAINKITDNPNVHFVLSEGWHERDQCRVWYAKLEPKVDKETYSNVILPAMRHLGWYWSNFVHSFATKNEDAFLALMNDQLDGVAAVLRQYLEKQNLQQASAAERLMNGAEARLDKADDLLNGERQTNTARRAAMAERGYAQGETLTFEAKILEEVAKAMLAEEVVFLKRIRAATQVESLMYCLNNARREARKALGTEEISDFTAIRYAKLPTVYFDRSDAKAILKEVTGKRGLRIANATMKTFLERIPKDDSGAYVPSPWINEFLDAVDKCSKETRDRFIGKFDEWKRITNALGLEKTYQLRAALREFLLYLPEKPNVVDQSRIMELRLVGLKIPGFFATPKWLAKKMVTEAKIKPEDKVLEPSAGSGRIADAIREIELIAPDCLEVSSTLRDVLEKKRHNVVGFDFMEYWEKYDVILMNPPFEGRQDEKHFRHAVELLNDDGRIFCITSAHWTFANDAEDFRNFINEIGATWEELPEGTFKESGTNVNTVLITYWK